MDGNGSSTRRVSSASARLHTRNPKKSGSSYRFSPSMIAQITVGLLAGLCGCVYLAIRPPPPKICGSPGGPPVLSPRVKLSDGRHLSYKERGVAKEEAKYKVISVHGSGDSKDFHLPISEELLKELRIYILSFDRAGYGESDPHPARSVKSEAYDIQELADQLQLGPKFYVLGTSMGTYSVWSCLKYIPNRLAGAALVVPVVNFWWSGIPPYVAEQAFKKLLFRYRWAFRVAHYAPWLVHWWMTQKWSPALSVLEAQPDMFSQSDLEIIEKSPETPTQGQEKVLQQGIYESLLRDLMTGFGTWEFTPVDLSNPNPNSEGSFHIWQASEDKLVPFEINRYISKRLPWIQYHEVPDAGHLLIYNSTHCEAIFKSLLSL